ncbi:hypothetical protein [Gardnerella vaginalis]|uniref:hypothetical protein n=1 Tax=Gardnerella vaginalis TaxID=2702 RepID=UPI003D1605BF
MVTKGDRKTIVFFFANFKRGGEAMDFDYFYNRESERFNFLKVPEILVDGEEFKGLLIKNWRFLYKYALTCYYLSIYLKGVNKYAARYS